MNRFLVFISLALFAGVAASCHHHDEAEHHHDHASQLTVYSDDYELFAEVGELAAGSKCHILAHFTRLVDFKPVDSVKVTMVLTVGDAQQRVEAWPAPRGIYAFDVTPAAAGCASLMFEVVLPDSVASIGFPHLHVEADDHEADDHEADDAHHHDHEGHGHEAHTHGAAAVNGVAFTKEQSWKIDFGTEVCRPETFGAVLRTTARVESSQGDERLLTAPSSGIVVFSNPAWVEGRAVTVGERLFVVESDALADNNMGVRLQEVSAAYMASKADYERKQQLAEEQIVSRADLEKSRAAYVSAKAAYDNLKDNFSQKGAVVKSPIAGFVKNVMVKNGAYVAAGTPLATVSQNRDLFLRAEVQPRYLGALAHIVSTHFTLPNSGEVLSVEALGGALAGVGKTLADESPLVPVTFRIPNKVDLVAGGFVPLFIRTAGDDEVITVANDGIVEEMGSYFVFVQINPELFEKRLVSLGATDGVRTVVAQGLAEGERVVCRGAAMVRLAQGVGALDPHAGHVH